MSDMIQNFFKEAEKEINSQTENEYDEVWNQEKVSIENVFEEKQEETNEQLGSQTENTKEEKDDGEIQTESEPNKEEQTTNNNLITLTKPLKYRGQEIYPKTEDELIELAQKGLDYSFKMNKIAPYREIVDVAVKHNLTAKDIEDLIKLRDTSNNEVDLSENEMFFNEQTEVSIADSIIKQVAMKNKPLANKVKNIYNSLDDTFKYELNDEGLFKAFVGSVNTGEFEKVYNNVVKLKSQNPFMTWIEAYSNVVNGVKPKNVKEPNDVLDDVKGKSKRNLPQNKTIKEQYDEVWSKDLSINELEKMLIEGV